MAARIPFRTALLAASALALLLPAWAQTAPKTTRASLTSGESQASASSLDAAISGSGRFVVFGSPATNLAPGGDLNGSVNDIFVRDRKLGTTKLATVSSAEVQSNGESFHGSISADGRFVAFQSSASNLVAGDLNGAADVFIRNLTLGVTERVSVDSAEIGGAAGSYGPRISSGGRFVVFESDAANLVLGDTNGTTDVFVRDRTFGTTVRVSRSSGGTQGNDASYSASISGGGRFVVFISDASNLVGGDTNGVRDAFLHDLSTGATTRLSRSKSGAQSNGITHYVDLSKDGRYVVFDSSGSNLVSGDTNGASDIFLRDRKKGTLRLISRSSSGRRGNGQSADPEISGGGRFVVFESGATNLVRRDTNGKSDIFVRDTRLGTTIRVSRSARARQGNGDSGQATISGDGRYVAFHSGATNLVRGDSNGVVDIFVRGPLPRP